MEGKMKPRLRLCYLIPLLAIIITACGTSHNAQHVKKQNQATDTFYYGEPFLKVRTAVINSLKDARFFIKDAEDLKPNKLMLVARYDNINTLFEPNLLEIYVYITEVKPNYIKVFAPQPDPNKFSARIAIDRYDIFIKSLRQKKLIVVKKND
jgi:hypothetical protein